MPAPTDLSPPPAAPGDRPLAAVGWMVATGVLFVGVIATVKYLGDRVPAPQSAFLRYALGLVFLVPMWPALRSARLTRQALGLFTLRGVLHAAGVLCWFYAMTRITIAEVTAMNYLNPVYVTLGAALFLGERLQIRRILAVLAALLGALLILRPGVRELDPGHGAMLACAVFFAGSYLLAKRMTSDFPAAAVVGLLSIVVTLALAPVAASVWVAPTGRELALLLLVAAFATGGHYTMTLAFAAAPLAVSQPVIFLQLVWSVAVGVALFGEPIDPFVIGGGLVIVAAVTFIAWREARLKAQAGGRVQKS
ncbi:DMT family transporter [Rhodovulum sp. 12E13]|uniref:DMT family transporter n=1 Tax=Rhodovulum sp. 12E13 TaxID=2203891 RepID=UPI003518EF53